MNEKALVHDNAIYDYVQDFLIRHWQQYPEVTYLPFIGDSSSDSLWGTDITNDDDPWGCDLHATEPQDESPIQPESVSVNLYITDRCGLWARKIGYDKADDVIMVAPIRIFENSGIEPKKYDKVDTGRFTFSVIDVKPLGIWKDTNKHIYQSMNCRVI